MPLSTSTNTILNIYESLIHPYLTMVLLPTYKTYLNKILILQKRVLCLLYFADWQDHAIPLFLKAKRASNNFLY